MIRNRWKKCIDNISSHERIDEKSRSAYNIRKVSQKFIDNINAPKVSICGRGREK